MIFALTLGVLMLGFFVFLYYITHQKPKPVLKPVTPLIPKAGIGDAWHPDGGLPASIVNEYAMWGGDLTIRVPVLSVAQAETYYQCVKNIPSIHTLILVEDMDLALVTALAPWVVQNNIRAFELANERDLAGATPEEFANFVKQGYDILRKAGYTGDIISGGIYTVTEQTLNWAKPMLAACPDVIFGVHWYGDNSDSVCAMLQATGRRIAVTEFGVPSGITSDKGKLLTDADQVSYLQTAYAQFQKVPVEYALVYQRPSGPSNSGLDNFGIQRFDGTWKPSVAVVCAMVRNS